MKVAKTVATGVLTSNTVVTSKDETGQLLQAFELGEGALIVLARPDGAVLAETQDATRDLKVQSMLIHPAFERVQSSTYGRYTGTWKADGFERFFAWRLLPRYGLVVIVGQSIEDAYGAYAGQRSVYLGASVAGSIQRYFRSQGYG